MQVACHGAEGSIPSFSRPAAAGQRRGKFLPQPRADLEFCAFKDAYAALLAITRRWHSFCFSYTQGAFIAMFDNIFGIHEQALLLHGQRLGVLAANIANADTPNYKARDIDFSAVLAQTDGQPLPVRVTQAAHIAASGGEFGPGELKYRNPYQASLDGNTVEMPVEQAAFSENNVRYQASLTFINLKIAQLQLAIAGQ
jgi:flagellar basal-body rod protein FlgB